MKDRPITNRSEIAHDLRQRVPKLLPPFLRVFEHNRRLLPREDVLGAAENGPFETLNVDFYEVDVRKVMAPNESIDCRTGHEDRLAILKVLMHIPTQARASSVSQIKRHI